MAARSVSELLPRAFEELALRDVKEIVRTVGEERESLYFERKASVTPASLAKSCSAFANTYGGILLVGIDNETDDLVGIESVGGEPQVWVKDCLRGHVLPMPASRARFVPLAKKSTRGVLLVLVEESSTTPHLLTRSGAIYVRNPGSSDPVPIGDQALLLELTRRGREARETARKSAIGTLDHRWWSGRVVYTLALAPTGSPPDVVRELYGSGRVELLGAAAEIHDFSGDHRPQHWAHPPEWELGHVRVQREIRRHPTQYPEAFLDGVNVSSNCVVQMQRGLLPRDVGGDPEPRGPDPLYLDQAGMGIIAWFSEALKRGRELILELGGHGDLFVAFGVQTAGRTIYWDQHRAEPATNDLRLMYWATLDDEGDEALTEQVRQDLRRSLGVNPADS